jgi:hypothetical protein
MKTYALLILFSSISYIIFRRKFAPLVATLVSATTSTVVFLGFVVFVEGALTPLWLVGFIVSFFLCLLWCGALAAFDQLLRIAKARRDARRSKVG